MSKDTLSSVELCISRQLLQEALLSLERRQDSKRIYLIGRLGIGDDRPSGSRPNAISVCRLDAGITLADGSAEPSLLYDGEVALVLSDMERSSGGDAQLILSAYLATEKVDLQSVLADPPPWSPDHGPHRKALHPSLGTGPERSNALIPAASGGVLAVSARGIATAASPIVPPVTASSHDVLVDFGEEERNQRGLYVSNPLLDVHSINSSDGSEDMRMGQGKPEMAAADEFVVMDALYLAEAGTAGLLQTAAAGSHESGRGLSSSTAPTDTISEPESIVVPRVVASMSGIACSSLRVHLPLQQQPVSDGDIPVPLVMDGSPGFGMRAAAAEVPGFPLEELDTVDLKYLGPLLSSKSPR